MGNPKNRLKLFRLQADRFNIQDLRFKISPDLDPRHSGIMKGCILDDYIVTIHFKAIS